MKKKVAFVLSILMMLITFYSLQSFSQTNDVWHRGMVKLKSGDIIQGEISYDFQYDNVRIREDRNGAFTVYSPFQVDKFSFMDTTYKVPRDFYSIPYQREKNFIAYHFFEVLIEGPVTLLSQEFVVERVGNVYRAVGLKRHPSYADAMLKDRFFIMNDRGFFMLNDPERDLHRFLDSSIIQGMAFYKKNKFMNLNTRPAMMAFITHYNQLIGLSAQEDRGEI